MKTFSLIFLFFFSLNTWAGIKGTATCFYQVVTKSNIENPVITPEFKLNLEEVEYVNTDHEILKRTLRLRYSPTSTEGKRFTHLNFSMTYDGAHTGATVPAKEGHYIFDIGRDESDLIGAFLNCRVSLGRAEPATKYSQVHCVNTHFDQEYQSVLYTHKKKNLYSVELTHKDKSRKGSTTQPLKDSYLYIIDRERVHVAGPDLVVEFKKPLKSASSSARITHYSPYYESFNWLCKAQ